MANTCSNVFKTITDFINYGSCLLIKSVVPLLFSLATVGFIYGVIIYFINPENEEKRSQGKSYILWGLIGLFVMVSIWGLVSVFSNTLNMNNKLILPQLNTVNK
jgi:FtsH-binding integral membrane protein